MAVRRLDGTAVARTEKTESSEVGNETLRLARLDVRDPLSSKCQHMSNGEEERQVYSCEAREAS
jgi:hypothetical protein